MRRDCRDGQIFRSMTHFCTYFDSGYLARGLALYRSLERHIPKFTLHILCFDDVTYDALSRAQLSSIKLLRLVDVEFFDRELLAAKDRRSLAEYYFTVTSVLPGYLFDAFSEIDAITYIDSDLLFFSNPAPVFEEMGDAAVAITPHRFTPHNKAHIKYGIYNVGWLTWRREARAFDCLQWYRSKSLEWCYDVVEDERYADQKYLDTWTSRFPGIHSIDHKGANLAPWNVGNYRISKSDEKIYVDDDPLIFYHFHGLKGGNDIESWRALIKFYLNPDAPESPQKTRFAALVDKLLSPISRNRIPAPDSPESFDVDFLMSSVYRPYLDALTAAQGELDALCLAPVAAGRQLRYVAEPPLAAASSAWRTELDWKSMAEQEKVIWPPALPLSADRLRAIELRALPTGKPEFDAARLARCARVESLVASAVSALGRAPALVDTSERDELIDHAFEVMPRISHRRWTAVTDQVVLEALQHQLPELLGAPDSETALAKAPDILLIGTSISRTYDWSGALHRLAHSARWLILEMRTFSGTPTTLMTCRDVGAATPRPYWIINRIDFLSALEREALTIMREIVLPDPARIPDIPELADHRLFLISNDTHDDQ